MQEKNLDPRDPSGTTRDSIPKVYPLCRGCNCSWPRSGSDQKNSIGTNPPIAGCRLPESQVWVNHRGNSILRFHRSRRAQPRVHGHAHARVCSRIASLHRNDHYAGDALACACNAPLHKASRRLCSREILRGQHTSSRLYFPRSILSI